MRGLVLGPAALAVMALAVWAYRENYRTQEAARQAEALSAEIVALRERLTLLQAEWAYLNRPDRLAELADANFDRLGLLPFAPEQFGAIDEVTFPPVAPPLDVEGVIETVGVLDAAAEDRP